MLHHDGKDDDTQPQVEEGIIECRWIHLSDLPEYRETLRARIEYFLDFWHSNLADVPRPSGVGYILQSSKRIHFPTLLALAHQGPHTSPTISINDLSASGS